MRKLLVALLLLFVLGISTLGQYYLPIHTARGGAFLQYKNYLAFTAKKGLEPLHKGNMDQQGYWLWHHRILFLFNDIFPMDENIAFEQAAFFNTKNF